MTQYTIDQSRDWYNNLPGKRTSAAIIVRHNGRILMVKDDYKPAMTFPGGNIDPEEGAKAAAIRETREEVGIDLSPEEVVFHSVAYISEHKGFKDRFHFYFLADVSDDVAATMKLEKGIEYHKWVEPKMIGELAGGRLSYVELQTMLVSDTTIPYFEV